MPRRTGRSSDRDIKQTSSLSLPSQDGVSNTQADNPENTGNPVRSIKDTLSYLLTSDDQLKQTLTQAIASSIAEHLLKSTTLLDDITTAICTNANLIAAITESVKDQVTDDICNAMSADNAATAAETKTIAENQQKLSILCSKYDDKIDELEQYSRRNCLLIHGIEENQSENTTNKAIDTFDKLDINIDTKDIDRSHRLGRKSTNSTSNETHKRKPRPIIVKFVSYAQRNLVFRNKRKLKHSGISISENLTTRRQQLLREASSSDAIDAAWTSDGKVICLLKNGKKVTLTTLRDLSKID